MSEKKAQSVSFRIGTAVKAAAVVVPASITAAGATPVNRLTAQADMPADAHIQALIEARAKLVESSVETKVETVRGDVKATTEAVTGLKGRLDDLTKRLEPVPASVATLTERVAHLPSKEYMVKAASVSLAIVAALITFGEKLQSLVR